MCNVTILWDKNIKSSLSIHMFISILFLSITFFGISTFAYAFNINMVDTNKDVIPKIKESKKLEKDCPLVVYGYYKDSAKANNNVPLSLFELIKEKHFKEKYDNLFSRNNIKDEWIKKVNGTAGNVIVFTIAPNKGSDQLPPSVWLYMSMCKPHDCDGNSINLVTDGMIIFAKVTIGGKSKLIGEKVGNNFMIPNNCMQKAIDAIDKLEHTY